MRCEVGRQACIFVGSSVDKSLVEAIDRCATCKDQVHPPWMRTKETVGTNVAALAVSPSVAECPDRNCWNELADVNVEQQGVILALGEKFKYKKRVYSVEHQVEWTTAWVKRAKKRAVAPSPLTTSVRTFQKSSRPNGGPGEARGPQDLFEMQTAAEVADVRDQLLVTSRYGTFNLLAMQIAGVWDLETLMWEKLRSYGSADDLKVWLRTKAKGGDEVPCWCCLCQDVTELEPECFVRDEPSSCEDSEACFQYICENKTLLWCSVSLNTEGRITVLSHLCKCRFDNSFDRNPARHWEKDVRRRFHTCLTWARMEDTEEKIFRMLEDLMLPDGKKHQRAIEAAIAKLDGIRAREGARTPKG